MIVFFFLNAFEMYTEWYAEELYVACKFQDLFLSAFYQNSC